MLGRIWIAISFHFKTPERASGDGRRNSLQKTNTQTNNNRIFELTKHVNIKKCGFINLSFTYQNIF